MASPSESTLNAVIYTRVSKLANPTGGADRSISVADQERECLAVCEKNDWPVRATFCDDGVSASRYSTKHRIEWDALKSELRQGDILVVWEASRAHRDLGEYVELRNLCSSLNVPLSYAGRILDLTRGDDRFVGGLDALIAERESEQIKERVLRGKRSAAIRGRPSGRPPWGYRHVRTDAGTHVPGEWELHPVEAPRVRSVVARLLDGESFSSLYRWMKETEGWTPQGKTVFTNALANPALAGLRVHRGEVVGDGLWRPIITKDEHDRILRRLRMNKREGNKRGPEPKHLLSGVAKCGVCGTGLEYKNLSYNCPEGHASLRAEEMDDKVFKRLLDIQAEEDPQDYEDVDDPIADAAEKEIDDIQGELDEWIVKATRREVSPTAFAKIESGLLARIAELEPKTVRRVPLPPIATEDLAEGWHLLPMPDKRTIVRAYVEVKLLPYTSVMDVTCGHDSYFARGLCHMCYQRARRAGSLPPKLERVIIERV